MEYKNSIARAQHGKGDTSREGRRRSPFSPMNRTTIVKSARPQCCDAGLTGQIRLFIIEDLIGVEWNIRH